MGATRHRTHPPGRGVGASQEISKRCRTTRKVLSIETMIRPFLASVFLIGLNSLILCWALSTPQSIVDVTILQQSVRQAAHSDAIRVAVQSPPLPPAWL